MKLDKPAKIIIRQDNNLRIRAMIDRLIHRVRFPLQLGDRRVMKTAKNISKMRETDFLHGNMRTLREDTKILSEVLTGVYLIVSKANLLKEDDVRELNTLLTRNHMVAENVRL